MMQFNIDEHMYSYQNLDVYLRVSGKETLMTKRKPATIAVRTGIESDTQFHAVVPPIYLSTNYGSLRLAKFHNTTIPVQQPKQRFAGKAHSLKLEGGEGAVVTNWRTSALNLLALQRFLVLMI